MLTQTKAYHRYRLGRQVRWNIIYLIEVKIVIQLPKHVEMHTNLL